MQIDWLTVTAQLVNFLILVALLKRFLYAPVLAAMDRRQARVREVLEAASRREADAEHTERELNRRIAEFDRDQARARVQAEQEVAAERNQMLTALREEMARTRSEWQQALERERDGFVHALGTESARLTVELARRALTDLADETLEQRVVERFLSVIETLDAERREPILRAPVLRIRTGFVLDAPSRANIEVALHRSLGTSAALEFVHAEDLICGVELEAGHSRVGWNLASYLQHVESRARELLSDARMRSSDLARDDTGSA